MAHDGTLRWGFHWHLLVDLDGVGEHLLVKALRTAWPGQRRVRIDGFRGRTERQFENSLRKLAIYPVKARCTRRDAAQRRRQWLAPHAVDQLAQWMMTRGSRWVRFNLGRAELPAGSTGGDGGDVVLAD